MESSVEKKLIEKLTFSDLPENCRAIAEQIGIENLFKLSRTYSSSTLLYVPVKRSILKNTRKRLILAEFNGYNAAELSLKYEVTQARISQIIKRKQEGEKVR